MKKMFLMSLVVAMVMLFASQVWAYPDLYLNQIGVDFNVAPTTESEMNYVPLLPLAEYYGMTINVDRKDKEVNGRWGKTAFTLKFETRLAEINGKREILDLPVLEVNGHILVPVNFMENLVKAEFRWRKSVVIIDNNNPATAFRVYLYTNKENYDFGEQIVATVIVKNISTSKVRVPLSSSQVYDLTLSYKGKELWRWSKDKMFTSAITYFELNPGESKVYTITLPRELILTPAQYQLTASFTSKPAVTSEQYTFAVR